MSDFFILILCPSSCDILIFLYRSLCLGKQKRIHLWIRDPEHTGDDEVTIPTSCTGLCLGKQERIHLRIRDTGYDLAASHPRPGNRSEKGASRGQELPPAAASLWPAGGGLAPARWRISCQCEPGRGGASQDVLSCCRLVPRKSGTSETQAGCYLFCSGVHWYRS